MKLKNLILIFCTAIMLFVFTGCEAADLSLNVEKWDKYNIHMISNQDIVITINNNDITTKQKMDTNLSMKVRDVDKDKNVTMEYKYDSMKIFIDSARQKMEYDSKQNYIRTPLSSIYDNLIGKAFTVKMDKYGHVLEINGLSEILNSIVDSIPGNAQQINSIRKTLNQSFGDDAMKSMIEQDMCCFPKNSFDVGDTWESNANIKGIFPMTINSKYKLLSDKDGLLNIDVQAGIVVDTQNEAVDLMGVLANVTLLGDCSGNINIDKKAGIVKNGSITQNISGEMEVLASKAVPQNVKVPMKINGTVTYEVTKQ